jgi:hypothetical protein
MSGTAESNLATMHLSRSQLALILNAADAFSEAIHKQEKEIELRLHELDDLRTRVRRAIEETMSA